MTQLASDRQPLSLFRTPGKEEAPPLPRFEELAMPLFPQLHRFARRLAPNQSDAEDLVQETYLKAQRNFGSFQPGTNVRAWMFRILKNTFLTSLATLDYRMTDAVAWQEEFAVSPSPATPESLVMTRFAREATQRAIFRLPITLREVILLRDVEGASYREVAELLSIPMGTVMSRLARARKLVRGSLKEHRSPLRPYPRNPAGVQPANRTKENPQWVVLGVSCKHR